MVEYLRINNTARECNNIAVYLRHDFVEYLLPFTGNVPAHVLVKCHANGQGTENTKAIIGEVGCRSLCTVESTVRYRLKHICRRYYGICCEALHRHTAAGAIDYRIGKIGGILKRSAAGTPCALICKVICLAACGTAGAAGLSASAEKCCRHNKYQHKRDYLFCLFHVVFPFNCLYGQTVSYFSSAAYMLIRYHICLNYKTCDSFLTITHFFVRANHFVHYNKKVRY